MTSPAPKQPAKKSSSGRIALFASAAVLLIVGVIVAVSLSTHKTSSSSSSSSRPATPASISAPAKVSGQAPLTFGSMPEVLYVGADFCPYCAAERWALVDALSRFGSFTNIEEIHSAPAPEAYPSTATYSFANSSYSSPYLVFTPVETQTVNHKPLMTMSAEQTKLFTALDPNGSIPFLDLGGSYVLVGSQYDPAYLAGATHAQVKSWIKQQNTATGQAIVQSADVLSADICVLTKGQPGSVCHSSAVVQAAKAAGITLP